MTRINKYTLVMTVWGMELSWLTACAAFIMSAAFNKAFPLVEATAASGLAIVLTAFTRSFCRRAIQSIGIHLLGYTAVCLWVIHVHENATGSFFNPQWLTAFFHQPKSLLQWIYLVLTLFWLFLFWLDGFKLVKQPKNYLFVRNRFDLGVGVFLAILLIELLIIVKTGIHIQQPTTEILMFPFLIFGMMAFVRVRNIDPVQRSFALGYGGIGMILSFAAVVLLTGTGLVILFLPHLTRAAEFSLTLIKRGAAPLGPVFIKILLFIFGPRKIETGLSKTQDQTPQPEIPVLPEAGESFFRDILGWGLLGFFLLISAALLAFIVWRLIQWLFARQPTPTGASNPLRWWVELFRQAWRGAIAIQQKLTAWVRGPQTGGQIYSALVGWGRFSGLPLEICETPFEYSGRLESRFPLLKNDIHQVVHTHSEIVYGSNQNSREKLLTARSALRRLRNPLNWPARMRSLVRR